MFGAAILLASALSPVTLSNDENRKISSTYPTWAVLQGRSSGTSVEVVVGPNGRMQECRVVAFVGSERMANEECKRFKGRRYRPATDLEGRPILGLYRTYITRVLDGDNEESVAVRNWIRPADATIRTGTLPDSATGRTDVGLVLLVKADGSVAECEGLAAANERARVSPALVDAACVEARKLTMARLTTAGGHPSDYVTNITMRFELNTTA